VPVLPIDTYYPWIAQVHWDTMESRVAMVISNGCSRFQSPKSSSLISDQTRGLIGSTCPF
jgi:hypothetical protein